MYKSCPVPNRGHTCPISGQPTQTALAQQVPSQWASLLGVLPGMPPGSHVPPGAVIIPSPSGLQHGVLKKKVGRPSKKRAATPEGVEPVASAASAPPPKKRKGSGAPRAPYNCKRCGQAARGHDCPNKDLPVPPKPPSKAPKPPCPHGGPGGLYARYRNCHECRSEVCQHNRRKLMCRLCTPENTAICIHNRDKGICKDCGTATRRCVHGRVKSICKVLFPHSPTNAPTPTRTPALPTAHLPEDFPPTIYMVRRTAERGRFVYTNGKRPTVKTVVAPRFVSTARFEKRVKNAAALRYSRSYSCRFYF